LPTEAANPLIADGIHFGLLMAPELLPKPVYVGYAAEYLFRMFSSEDDVSD
jgi:hypothetical protein